MSEHAPSFTADGPTVTGFQTGGLNITNGANFVGLENGVRGVGRFTGVVGEGGISGVEATGPMGVTGHGKSEQERPSGTMVGVSGDSEEGNTGVLGFVYKEQNRNFFPNDGPSDSVGVRGESDTGRGGAFLSRDSAQINLFPFLDALPAVGQAGDLVVINGPIDPEQPDFVGAILHICLVSGDGTKPGTPMWGRFLFDVVTDK